jgi:ankyrin repeat protein
VEVQNSGAPTSALWIASQEGHTELVRLLLVLGADVDARDPEDGRTALFQASQEGHGDIVRLLLDYGARVNVTSTRTGATPLFIAAARGHEDVVRMLLAANADIDIVASANGVADSPLSISRKRAYAGIAALIEQSGGTDPKASTSAEVRGLN